MSSTHGLHVSQHSSLLARLKVLAAWVIVRL
jgi:hypothetical protein